MQDTIFYVALSAVATLSTAVYFLSSLFNFRESAKRRLANTSLSIQPPDWRQGSQFQAGHDFIADDWQPLSIAPLDNDLTFALSRGSRTCLSEPVASRGRLGPRTHPAPTELRPTTH